MSLKKFQGNSLTELIISLGLSTIVALSFIITLSQFQRYASNFIAYADLQNSMQTLYVLLSSYFSNVISKPEESIQLLITAQDWKNADVHIPKHWLKQFPAILIKYNKDDHGYLKTLLKDSKELVLTDKDRIIFPDKNLNAYKDCISLNSESNSKLNLNLILDLDKNLELYILSNNIKKILSISSMECQNKNYLIKLKNKITDNYKNATIFFIKKIIFYLGDTGRKNNDSEAIFSLYLQDDQEKSFEVLTNVEAWKIIKNITEPEKFSFSILISSDHILSNIFSQQYILNFAQENHLHLKQKYSYQLFNFILSTQSI